MSSSVVSGSRKRAPAVGGKSQSATTRYDIIPNVPEPPKVFDAGGEGRETLTLVAQSRVQAAMYERTLDLSDLFYRNKEQEQRQTMIVDEVRRITVNVAREDFPAIAAEIPVAYTTSAGQAAWRQFLVDVRVALNLEFIEDILDRMDSAPVHRVLGLRDGGQYFVKQREASAILEVIQTGKLPLQVSWPVTMGINLAKENLAESGRVQVWMDKRVDEIINMPMIREGQRSSLTLLTEADSAQEVLDIMWDVMHAVDLPPEELKIALQKKWEAEEEARIQEEERVGRMKEALARGASAAELMSLNAEEPIRPVYVALTTHDKEVDIVLLHRVALETLSRLSARHPDKMPETATVASQFVLNTIALFREEIDIILLAVKAISDLAEYSGAFRREIFISICDTLQCYAPPPLFYLPRMVHRLLSQEELEEEERLFNLQFAFEDEDEFEAQEPVVDAEARILAQMAAMGVAVVGGLEEKEDDDTTVDAAPEQAVEEDEEEEEIEEEQEVVRERGRNEKKPWKGTYGFPGKPYKKTLKDQAEGEAKFSDFFGGGGDDDDDDDDPDPQPRGGKKKSKFKPAKFVLRPLPVTKGITHRGFTGTDEYKQTLILQQCFSTLYRLVSVSYGYREQAFDLFLHEEVSDIAVVCVGLPRLLEYTIWIVDKMYSDGFAADDEAADKEEVVTIDPSMQTSKDPGEARKQQKREQEPRAVGDAETAAGPAVDAAASDDVSAGPGDDESVDPITGLVIEAVSTVTQPSIDLEGVNRMLPPPEVNLGDNEEEMEPWTAGPITREEEPENITVSVVLDPEGKEKVELAKKMGEGMPNPNLRTKLGEKKFNRRYRGRPKDIVIIALALVSAHTEVGPRERDMALRLLGGFDDCTASYKFLVNRGIGLSG